MVGVEDWGIAAASAVVHCWSIRNLSQRLEKHNKGFVHTLGGEEEPTNKSEE